MFPRRLGATENPQQSCTVLIGDGGTELIQIVGKMINDPQHRIPVGKKDIVPHHRVAGCNSGEVPETARCVAENIQIFVLACQGIHQ